LPARCTSPMLEAYVKLDNALVWQSGLNPFYEVYYLKLNGPDWSFWARYTLSTSLPAHPGGAASVWAIFTDANGTKRAAKNTFDLSVHDVHHTEHFIQIGPSYLSLAEAIGQVEDAATPFKWDLAFEDPVTSLRLYPNALYYWLPFPRTKFTEPRLSTFVTGTLYVGDKKFSVQRAKCHQAHLWGEAYANDWSWANCIDFPDDESAFFEGLSARVPLGNSLSPPMSLFCVGFDEQIFRATSLCKSLWRNGSKVSGDEWQIRFISGLHRFDVQISRDPKLTAGVRYDGPNGEVRFCHNNGLANIEMIVSKLGLKGWREIAKLQAKQRCAFETVGPVAREGIPILLGADQTTP